MSKVLILLKTQNLRNDQRVLKEINSLKLAGAEIEIFVSKNCDITAAELNCPLYEVNLIGGAAPRNLLIRIIGVLQFYFMSILFLKKKNYDNFWICDPIMFGLIILLKNIKPKTKIIWDHHELPPEWFFKNKYLVSLFKKAYKVADIVIHTNNSRKNHLENILGINAEKLYIISNYPRTNSLYEEELDHEAEKWLSNKYKFVYLQNSLQENRYGSLVINSILKAGYKIFHAGYVNHEYLKKYKLYNDNLYLAGYLSMNQINRVLNKCEFTIILYKQDSLNQVFCDANRLYQAMALGVPLIIGNNPTLVESTSNYRNTIVVNNVGESSILDSTYLLVKEINNFTKRYPIIFNWNVYDNIFREILKND